MARPASDDDGRTTRPVGTPLGYSPRATPFETWSRTAIEPAGGNRDGASCVRTRENERTSAEDRMVKRTRAGASLMLATLIVGVALLVGGCTQGGPGSSGGASPGASSGTGGGY